MGEQHVPLYTSAYAGYDVRTRIRSLTYGDDVGQSGWLTADELERFARSLELDSGSRLLDVGCGAGGPALRLASTTGATVVGVDVLDEAVATARQLADDHGLADRATFVRADADRRLPFDDGASTRSCRSTRCATSPAASRSCGNGAVSPPPGRGSSSPTRRWSPGS